MVAALTMKHQYTITGGTVNTMWRTEAEECIYWRSMLFPFKTNGSRSPQFKNLARNKTRFRFYSFVCRVVFTLLEKGSSLIKNLICHMNVSVLFKFYLN